MTGLSAQRFGIPERGTISVGNYADLVLFDPNTIRDTGTYDNPTTVPIGIVGTWLNGQRVTDNGKSLSTRSGRFIRTLS